MDLLILTGMSGSGKSRALSTLEDVGYYCIDNLPPQFLVNFTDFMSHDDHFAKRVAITIDARSKEMFAQLSDVLNELDSRQIPYSLLYLDCDDSVLLTRYKETRRIHPLMNEDVKHINEAIQLERGILNSIRERADYYINTTLFTPTQLKERVMETFSTTEEGVMSINFVSFGYKYGILTDADLVFDVRCLPNPFYVKELKELTGNDSSVRDYVMSFAESRELLEKFENLLDFSIPLYQKEGKMQLVVGLGCTGGKHRSVTFARMLNEYFKNRGLKVHISHRDILKK